MRRAPSRAGNGPGGGSHCTHPSGRGGRRREVQAAPAAARCPPPSRPPRPGRAAGSAAVRRGQGRPSAPAGRVVAKEMERAAGGDGAGVGHQSHKFNYRYRGWP